MSLRRHTRARPCPVCGGCEREERGKGTRCHGYTTDGYTHCSRAEHAGALDAHEKTRLYVHRLTGECRCGTTHDASTRTTSTKSATGATSKRVVATYPYRDADGALLFEVVRYDPKGFSQRRADGATRDIFTGEGAAPRVLFRLPELLAADPSSPVYVAEGEKDAETLAARGIVATCNPHGAGKWRLVAEHAREVLAGRDVIIIADADAPGRAHAREVADALRGTVSSVRLTVPPAPHKDVTDLLTSGATLDALTNLADDEPQGASNVKGAPVLTRLSDVTPTPIRWLWRSRIPLGKLTVIDGDPKLGKSLIVTDLAARVSSGASMPDGSPGLDGPRGVVLLSAEDDAADTILPRLIAAKGDPSRVAALRAVRTDKGERWPSLADLPAIESALVSTGAALLVIDPIMAYLADADAHKDAEVRGLLGPLAALAAKMGVAFVLVRHLNKNPGGNALYRGGGSIAFLAAARSALVVAKDPDDETGRRRVLATTGTNNAPDDLPGYAYSIEVAHVPGVGEVPRVRWEGPHHASATDLLTPPRAERAHGRERAEAFLSAELAHGPRPVADVSKAAERLHISAATLRRAREHLGVVATSRGYGPTKVYTWELSGDAWEPPEDPLPGHTRGSERAKSGEPKTSGVTLVGTLDEQTSKVAPSVAPACSSTSPLVVQGAEQSADPANTPLHPCSSTSPCVTEQGEATEREDENGEVTDEELRRLAPKVRTHKLTDEERATWTNAPRDRQIAALRATYS